MAKKKRRRKKYRVLTLLFQTFFIVAFMACVAVALAIYAKYGQKVLDLYAVAQEIVEKSSEDDFKVSETSLVYDGNGDLLKTLKGERDTYYIESTAIPDDVKNAFIAIEDKKFYQHNGIDVKRIAGALVANVRGGGISQGGSTITQQLVKLTYLDFTDQSYERKIKEAFISVGIEKKYTKDQLLEYYINDINFANGYYGIQAAANGYFRKTASSLSLSQIAFLCAIPNSPEEFNPYTNKDNTLERRDLILWEMKDDGFITEEQYSEAVNEQIKLKKKKKTKVNSVDSFVMDCATKALMKSQGFEFEYSFDSDVEKDVYKSEYNDMYNKCEAQLFTNGYRIYTSIDPDKQKLLQKTVDEKMSIFTETYGDEKVYDMQAAATCIDNSSGRVVAIVGGRTQNLEGYTLNRAFQSYRQPGSSIKPVIVYTPAFEMGYTPDTIVNDKKLEEKDAPKNSGGGYRGRMKLRAAIESSLNTIAWQVYKKVTPDRGINYLLNMHYNNIASTDYVMATAVGGFTYGTNTLEQASAYSTIANGGKFREPTCIVTITDSKGTVLVSDEVEETEIYEKNA
ncbi:MAG: transglycosylase domain-containing protein, partial [Lachnospiraceae bacterium]|nr:transglycosylase domain-containing protein [Lachnospiraceae bacterium]